MTHMKQDAPLIVDALNSMDTWCVYQHSITMQQGEPPTVILVGACRLIDVYRNIEGKTNSEWISIFKNGGHLLVTIVATSQDKREAMKQASELLRSIKPIPVCNLAGYSTRGARRTIICDNNGRRYNTQMEASADLGVPASSISRHLRGELTHAGGLRFSYAPDDLPVPREKQVTA